VLRVHHLLAMYNDFGPSPLLAVGGFGTPFRIVLRTPFRGLQCPSVRVLLVCTIAFVEGLAGPPFPPSYGSCRVSSFLGVRSVKVFAHFFARMLGFFSLGSSFCRFLFPSLFWFLLGLRFRARVPVFLGQVRGFGSYSLLLLGDFTRCFSDGIGRMRTLFFVLR